MGAGKEVFTCEFENIPFSSFCPSGDLSENLFRNIIASTEEDTKRCLEEIGVSLMSFITALLKVRIYFLFSICR